MGGAGCSRELGEKDSLSRISVSIARGVMVWPAPNVLSVPFPQALAPNVFRPPTSASFSYPPQAPNLVYPRPVLGIVSPLTPGFALLGVDAVRSGCYGMTSRTGLQEEVSSERSTAREMRRTWYRVLERPVNSFSILTRQ